MFRYVIPSRNFVSLGQCQKSNGTDPKPENKPMADPNTEEEPIVVPKNPVDYTKEGDPIYKEHYNLPTEEDHSHLSEEEALKQFDPTAFDNVSHNLRVGTHVSEQAVQARKEENDHLKNNYLPQMNKTVLKLLKDVHSNPELWREDWEAFNKTSGDPEAHEWFLENRDPLFKKENEKRKELNKKGADLFRAYLGTAYWYKQHELFRKLPPEKQKEMIAAVKDAKKKKLLQEQKQAYEREKEALEEALFMGKSYKHHGFRVYVR